MKNAFSTLLTVLITAVVVGVLSGVITYSSVVSKKDLEIDDLKEQLNQVEEEAQVEPISMSLETEETNNQQSTANDKQTAEAPSSETTNETANWKTYTNEKYGFSFKYPENIEVKIQDFDKVVVIDPSLGEKQGNTTILTVMVQDPSIYENEEVKSILTLNLKEFTQKFYQMTKEAYISQIKEMGSIKTGAVGGRPAYNFSVTYDCAMTDYAMCGEYLFNAVDNQGGMKYTVTIPSFQKTSNQILSTFQFTK